ncbi:hypothetical protein PHYSODRAFT_301940 [Phytophthora sojae]|uniref:Uncharacterized protein n=1 Tax=Phytophthora sojae (strain P6497) TaxID=1094619 RepID=G4ZNU7_PHYSP|nr:hypothetical protein PHYSODRAFT_301940 [Phytophthora sojae]EGZ15415.1 hypothetical protein PHYSODRAFT_301940 [Phytophthora sojae]|eukprot:XP_009529164.1 hypothetical protein PHYSODRAFT_301940 [Phytophthora sojae]
MRQQVLLAPPLPSAAMRFAALSSCIASRYQRSQNRAGLPRWKAAVIRRAKQRSSETKCLYNRCPGIFAGIRSGAVVAGCHTRSPDFQAEALASVSMQGRLGPARCKGDRHRYWRGLPSDLGGVYVRQVEAERQRRGRLKQRRRHRLARFRDVSLPAAHALQREASLEFVSAFGLLSPTELRSRHQPARSQLAAAGGERLLRASWQRPCSSR